MAEHWLIPLQRALAAEAKPRPEIAPYSLRLASAADEPSLYEMHRHALRAYVEQTWGWEEDWQRLHFREHYRPADNAVIVHDAGGAHDVGRISLTRHWHSVFLRDIELDRAHRDRGLGSALLRSVIALATSEGKRVDLHVLRCNPARHLYERHGFRVAGGDDARLLMRKA